MRNERRRGRRPDQVPARCRLGSTIKYLNCYPGIGLGTTIKYLLRSTSGAAGNGLCTTIKYLVN